MIFDTFKLVCCFNSALLCLKKAVLLVLYINTLTESNQLQEDLAELSGEISLKQRMIEELEKSQRQLQNIRQHYEDKLRNLQDQIKAIERERDQVLNSLGIILSCNNVNY